MSLRSLAAALLTLCAFAASATAASTDTHYLSPTGVDAGDCTNPEAPCGHLSYVQNAASPGGHHRLRLRDYWQNAWWMPTSPLDTRTITKANLTLRGAQAGVPGSHDFGSVVTGKAARRTFAVENVGGLPLAVSAVSVGGAQPGDFVIEDDECSGTSVASEASCAVVVRFSPSAVGARSAVLQVASDGVEPLVEADLAGTGVLPPAVASFAPKVVSFADVPAGEVSAPQTVTVTTPAVRRWT